ncbi:hypothetical protein Taro_037891 [Colocasia esculenta]|uniref:Uncharacterized protein n=1 Tax=Colocasia esculenta TaxID=4460 RepID=A0A843W1U9_COLES|nr:hypothetical protein [Colocasia esculenta]
MAAAAAVSSLALGFLCSLPHRPSSSSRFPSLSPRKAGRSTIVATAGPPTRGSSRPRGTPAQEERDVNNGFLPQVIMTFKRKSKSRMGMRPSDERFNYESSYSSLF